MGLSQSYVMAFDKGTELMDRLPLISERMAYQEFDGEIVLFDKKGKKTFKLNRVASLIFFFCDGSHSASEILKELIRVFPKDNPSVLSADLRQTLEHFEKEGIVR